MARKNAFYAQSGGVTAVINASACGLIETARRHRDKIGKVYAGRHGIIGALTEDMIDVSKESRAAISALRHTPGGAFGSARYKLAGIDKNRAQYTRLIDIFRAHDIGYFFYNGGNDSMDTAQKVSEIAGQMGVSHHLRRDTQDRRQRFTDHRLLPRFRLGRQVHRRLHARGGPRCRFDGANLDQGLRARSDGAARRMDRCRRRFGGGKSRRRAAHHLVSRNRVRSRGLLAKVKATVEKRGYCVIVVSEGVQDADGKFLAEAGTKDAFGHAQLGGVGPVVAQMTQQAFGYKFHWAVADYLQRSARHIASKVDVEQAYAVGKAAVELALKGRNAVMPVIVRKSSKPYRWSIGEAPLVRRCQSGEKGAAQLHHRGWLRHHGRLPPLSIAPHWRRRLPSLPRRLASLCHIQGRQRSEALAHPVCDIVASLFLTLNS